jgi:enoyl-CoA hydratase/carnithine racemase
MLFQYITLERDEQERGVVTLTLNRPDSHNAMTPDMGEEVTLAIAQVRDDPDARVMIVTGAGKSFCSGGDLGMLARDSGLEGATGPSMGDTPRQFYDRFLSLRSLPVPTIAAINGPAIGAGLCLALACDLRVAAAGATMGMTFVRVGIHPGMGATYLLPSLVGTAKAFELFFTGRIFDATEALSYGLVNRVVARPRLLEEVGALASEIAASAPIAVRTLKESIYRMMNPGLEQALEFESRQQAATFATLDAKEGITAIIERRKPRFRGE